MFCSITKETSFEASHQLKEHKGACKNLHGHSYKVEVSLGRCSISLLKPLNLEQAMILDFSDFSKVLDEIIVKKYDHKHLNDFFEYPTAEVLATNILRDLKEYFKEQFNPKGTLSFKVRLWETATSFVTVEGNLVE